MIRRKLWAILAIAFAVGLVVLFPLRLAIDLSTGPESSLSARQIGGTIWDGRIGDLGLQGQPLGTFDVAAKPLPMLTGRFELDATRVDAGDGPLSMRLVTGGGREGVIGAQGRVEVARWMAPVPVEALLLEDVTVLFEDGRCATAEGSVRAVASFASLLNIDEYAGDFSCAEDGRAKVAMTSSRGGHSLALLFDANGSAEAEARTRGAPPALAAAMQLGGFVVEGDELVLRKQVR